MSLVARALAHPVRIQIIELLAVQTECRGHELFSELPLAQSTVSGHLRVLREAGVVSSSPVGTSMVYCLVPQVLEQFAATVDALGSTAERCAIEGCR